MTSEIQQFTALYNTLINFVVNYSFQIVGAVFILFIGIMVARKVSNWVLKLCLRQQLDQTFSSFVASTVKIAVVALVSIMALSKVGISITPLLATIGAISLGAGLAVQGLVSNYGAGLNIILTQPFVVGDTIEVNGVKGLVKEVHLGYTLLVDEDDTSIIVPNRHIVGEVIKNSQQDTLIEASIGVAYGQSPQMALQHIYEALENSTLLTKERPIKVGIDNFADSAITITVRVWAPTERYNATRFQINQLIYETVLSAGLSVPYPRREVYLMK